MSAILYTRRAGAGKTDIALEAIRGLIENDPIRQVWVLLPTELQTASFRARLYDKLSRPVFGVEVFDFYALYTRLLQATGNPERRVQETARFRILRHVIESMPLEYFGNIGTTPGFVRTVAAFIQEAKQAKVYPEHLQAAAQTPKDRELAAIYANYQQFLREKQLVDSEGEGWLALEKVSRSAVLPLRVHQLIVDGFDQLTLVQTELLAALAQRIDQVIITLTYEPERDQTALRRFGQTRERLLYYLPELAEIMPDAASESGIRPEPLAYLSRQIFEANDAPATFAEMDSVQLLELPDQRREVEEVLRRVKRLLHAGTPAERIAVVARDLRAYAPYLLEIAAEYELPIHLRGGSPLSANPAIATLLKLIDLHVGDFRRLPVLEVLSSPYLAVPGLDDHQVAMLDRLSRSRLVTHSMDHWLAAIYAASREYTDENGEVLPNLLTPEQAETLGAALEMFFERITPPTEATVYDYIAWLESIIGTDPDAAPLPNEETDAPLPDTTSSFGLIGQIRANEDYAARDLAAMRCLQRVFRDMLASEELLAAQTSTVTWEVFRRDLGIAVENTMVALHRDGGRDAGRSASVLVSTVYEARGLTHDHVFLLGLSEGQFPAPAREDLLYHDSERRRINGALNEIYQTSGIDYLVTRAAEADEKSLFYEMTAIPLQSLTLSRPYHEKGSDWPASPYWKAVQRVLAVPIQRTSMSRSVDPINAARFTELMTALAEALNHPDPAPETFQILEWVTRHPDYAPRWENATLSRNMERLRAAKTEHAYRGFLLNPENREQVQLEVGAGRVWSASQLNELGLCPFQFFAKRLLKLEELEEPEPGADRLQIGSVVHAALQTLYARFHEEGLTITPDDWPRAEPIIAPMLTDVLNFAPRRFSFRPDALWEQEKIAIMREVTEFVALDFSDESPIGKILPGVRRSVYQEAKFGAEGSFILHTEAGPLTVRGTIDRIDVVDDQAIVVDYKTGGTKHSLADLIAGRDVQLLMYLEGARDVLPESVQVVHGVFLYIRGQEEIGKVDVAANADALEQAKARIAELIIGARAGRFPNEPSRMINGKCSVWCKYSQLCRAGLYS
jgi:ATP-dependent helicase/DNAse subunit B